MSRHLINNALRTQHTQHRATPTRNLRPARVLNDTRTQPKTDGLRLHQQHFVFGLTLQGDLGLSAALPALEDRAVGGF